QVVVGRGGVDGGMVVACFCEGGLRWTVMSWGRRVLLAPVVLAGVMAFGAPALAAKPLLGTIDRGWISKAQGGTPIKVVPQSAPSVFASFIWKRSPSAKLPLEMRWIGPQGLVRAAWKSTTLKT